MNERRMSGGARPARPSISGGGGGSQLRHHRRTLLGAILVVLVAVAVAGGLASSDTVAASRRVNADSSYGTYPSWLLNTKLPPVNTILRASLSHPRLEAVEGNTMDVQLPGGAQAEITAVGPSFPAWVSAAAQAGTLGEGSAVPTSFRVAVIARRGTVPLRGSAFSILTAAGQLLHPTVTVPGGVPLPATLRAGQHLVLTINAKLVEGDGSLRWAPTGTSVVSGWLYQLELD